jgi:5'-3' exonuclease
VTVPLLILDTATLYYRAFFALPEKLTAPGGHPNNAIRGFLSMLTKMINIHSPSGLVAAWDTDWRPEWRVALMPSYKTHRLQLTTDPELASFGTDVDNAAQLNEELPDTLGPQIQAISQILDACGVARIGFENFEADDVIASVAAQSKQANLIVTSDKDLMQVVSDQTSMLLQTTGGVEGWPILGPEDVLSRFGVTVEQYVDYAVLRGDPSDGLPGVPGIGEKTAASLITAFGNIQNLVSASFSDPLMKPMTPRLADRIQESINYLEAAKTVITAEVSLPVQHWSTSLPLEPLDPADLTALSEQWGVDKYVKDLFQALAG